MLRCTPPQSQSASQPAIYASFQPLSHMAERIMLPSMMLSGGRIGFVSPGNAELFAEIKVPIPLTSLRFCPSLPPTPTHAIIAHGQQSCSLRLEG